MIHSRYEPKAAAGLKLKRQAKTIHQTAVELNDALPAYRSAEQAGTCALAGPTGRFAGLGPFGDGLLVLTLRVSAFR